MNFSTVTHEVLPRVCFKASQFTEACRHAEGSYQILEITGAKLITQILSTFHALIKVICTVKILQEQPD